MTKGKQAKLPLLDLHGVRTDEVFDLVDKFLLNHSQKGTRQVCIMSGKGTGAVQKKLQEYLKLAGYPWRYESQSNTGSLIVFVNEE